MRNTIKQTIRTQARERKTYQRSISPSSTGLRSLYLGGVIMEPCKLHILSLHDAQAECTCDHWHMMCTGERTKQEIQAEYLKHNAEACFSEDGLEMVKAEAQQC